MRVRVRFRAASSVVYREFFLNFCDIIARILFITTWKKKTLDRIGFYTTPFARLERMTVDTGFVVLRLFVSMLVNRLALKPWWWYRYGRSHEMVCKCCLFWSILSNTLLLKCIYKNYSIVCGYFITYLDKRSTGIKHFEHVLYEIKMSTLRVFATTFWVSPESEIRFDEPKSFG